MSVTLTLIKKQKEPVKVYSFLETYLEKLNQTYTTTELQTNPVIFKSGHSVLGFVVESKEPVEVSKKDLTIKTHTLSKRNLAVVKISYHETANPLDQLKEIIEKNNLGESPFISILHTARIYENLDRQPPRLTHGGNIYMSVGAITKYFLESGQKTWYKGDTRGIEFAKRGNKENPEDIIKDYFSDPLDTQDFDKLTLSEFTGMKHLTTLIYEKENKLLASFLQPKGIGKAYYFFRPDIAVSNSECVLRGIRATLYPNSDIPLKRRLHQATFSID